MTRGRGGAYLPPWFLPMASSTGAGMKPHAGPFQVCLPLIWGDYACSSIIEGGTVCNPHAVPIPVRLPPVGGDFLFFIAFHRRGMA